MRMNYNKAIARAEKKVSKMNVGNQLALMHVLVRKYLPSYTDEYAQRPFEQELDSVSEANDVEFFLTVTEDDDMGIFAE